MSRRNARARQQRGSVLMIAVFVLIVLSLLGIGLLTLSGTESNIAQNALWTEGAFAAAEAGVQTGLNQLSANAGTSITPIPPAGPAVTIGTGIRVRSSACRISMERALVRSRRRYPLRSSASRCRCTVQLERSPSSSPISRTVGG